MHIYGNRTMKLPVELLYTNENIFQKANAK
jgi:hypothetical protein